ncbi:MAG: trypsin-like peptidase domain-containing protein [Planctomycetes bacterium]|nr:trypsin-like peptidase domain-containing protein [Planctomycetota bacterium]
MHRISMRFVRVTGAALLAVGLGFLGSFLMALQQELADARGTIDELRETSDVQRTELQRLRTEMVDVDRNLDHVRIVEASARARLLQEIEARTEAGAAMLRTELGALEERLKALRAAAEEHGRMLADVRQQEDIDARSRALMGPTVRINGTHEVGSGSVLWSRATGPGRARSYVLTAWHILQKEAEGALLEVDVYEDGQPLRTDRGRVVAHDRRLDLALVEVDAPAPHRHLANLPDRVEMNGLRIFTPIYAIGCPLGYPPLPTSGELTSRDKVLDGNHYWMVNAPTIFGNSGGGIYTAQTHQLIGVLSRISAYKNMIDVAVPHMGLVTPIHRVYDWLDKTRYGFVYLDRLAEGQVSAQAPTPADATATGSLPASATDAVSPR